MPIIDNASVNETPKALYVVREDCADDPEANYRGVLTAEEIGERYPAMAALITGTGTESLTFVAELWRVRIEPLDEDGAAKTRAIHNVTLQTVSPERNADHVQLAAVRIELDAANRGIAAFYERADEDCAEPGRTAMEALMRAVSNLTRVVERLAEEQHPC